MKRIIAVLAIAMTMMLVLAGCSKSLFKVEMGDDGRSADITCENAEKDDYVFTGTLTAGENDKIVIDQQLEGEGSISVRFIPVDVDIEGDADAELEDLLSIAEQEYTLEAILLGEAQDMYILPAGDYHMLIVVQDGKVSGTARITVEESDPFSAWNPADSAQAAAEGIGLDSFVVPEGTVTALGEVKVESYHYNDHVAMANIPFPAVQMYIMKGTDGDVPGDISGDFAEYAFTWTQDVNGLPVTCSGNREGEATKTVWSVDGVSYALLTYGLGGDTDYGLQAADVAALVAGTK